MRIARSLLLGSLVFAVLVVLTRDPEEALAVYAVIGALAVAAGSLVAMLLLSWAPRAVARRRAAAARWSVETGAAVGLLLLLRFVDGLSVVTAAFVVVSFVAAEAVLSARPRTYSR